MAVHRPGPARSAHKAETTYIFEGALTGVDADADTFTVAVEEGNKAARTYPGEQTFTIEDGYTKVGVGEVEKRASRTWWVSRSAAH